MARGIGVREQQALREAFREVVKEGKTRQEVGDEVCRRAGVRVSLTFLDRMRRRMDGKKQAEKRVNRLGGRETTRVIEWLIGHREELLRDRPDYAPVALRVAKELGFEVTTRNVANLAKTLSFRWKPKHANREGNPTSLRLHNRVEKLAAALTWACHILSTTTGEKIPESVLAALNGEKEEGK